MKARQIRVRRPVGSRLQRWTDARTANALRSPTKWPITVAPKGDKNHAKWASAKVASPFGSGRSGWGHAAQRMKPEELSSYRSYPTVLSASHFGYNQKFHIYDYTNVIFVISINMINAKLLELIGGKAPVAGGARPEAVAWIRVLAQDFVGFGFGSMRCATGCVGRERSGVGWRAPVGAWRSSWVSCGQARVALDSLCGQAVDGLGEDRRLFGPAPKRPPRARFR